MARPSTVSADLYPDVSAAYYTAVNQILIGAEEAPAAVETLAGRTRRHHVRALGFLCERMTFDQTGEGPALPGRCSKEEPMATTTPDLPSDRSGQTNPDSQDPRRESANRKSG